MRIKIKKHNKWIIASIITVLLIAASTSTYLFFAHKHLWWPYRNTSTIVQPVNTDPNIPDPSYSSTKTSDKNNSPQTTNSNTNTTKTSGNTASPSTSSTQNKQEVGVALTYAGTGSDPGTIEVRAFVSGVIEGDGTCTATFTNNSSSITQSSPGFIDATTTQCEPMIISKSKLSPGQWKVTVQYTSPTSTGVSQSNTVNV